MFANVRSVLLGFGEGLKDHVHLGVFQTPNSMPPDLYFDV